MNEEINIQEDSDSGHIVPRSIKPPQVPRGNTQVDPLVPDSFLQDPDPYITTVLCANCRTPLFKIEARVSDQGLLLSTKTSALGPWEYESKNDICPVCKGTYPKYEFEKPRKFLTSKGWI